MPISRYSKALASSLILFLGTFSVASGQLYSANPAPGGGAAAGSGFLFEVISIDDTARAVGFRVRPSGGGTFASTGTFHFREGSVTGAVVATQAFTAGFVASELAVELDFSSGSKTYYAVTSGADADGAITADEWAGPVTVTYLSESSVPVVRHIRASQDEGKRTVTVRYDLIDSDSATLAVTLEASADGGNTWDIPINTVNGDAGDAVRPGANRAISWDAGTDWPEMATDQMKFRITATEPLPSAPTGFALIPAGSFQMGDSFGDGSSSERPMHSVFVSAFYMAKHETTKELWDEVRAWGLNNGYMDLVTGNGSYASKGANHPVHSVSWYDIVKWCNARSQKEGLTPCYTVGGAVFKTGENASVTCDFAASGYRLPTEAEWEKAARGGLSGKRFPWGDTINHSRANYRAVGDRYPYDDSPFTDLRYHPTYNDGSTPYSSPVGSFAPNGYGLYDMAGNMWEWCWDRYSGSYYSSSPQTDPRGPTSGSYRVFRGGSWYAYGNHCRVAYRLDGTGLNPIGRSNHFGFRVSRSSVPQ